MSEQELDLTFSSSDGLRTQFLTQTAWFIDPQNRSGNAHNTNSGADAAHPVHTWSEVHRRYGTTSPILPVGVTYTFLSSSPSDGSDPVVLFPVLSNFSSMRITGQFGAAQKVASGALASVSTVGGILQANLGASGAVGQVLQNTTVGKESRCQVLASLGGNVFQLSAPQTISDAWPTTPSPTLVTTYANVDTFDLYLPDQVDIVALRATVAEFDSILANQFTVVQNLAILNPSTNTNFCYLPDTFAALCVRSDRRVALERSNGMGRNSIFYTCNLAGIVGGIDDIQAIGNQPRIFGGAVGRGQMVGFYLDNKAILRNSGTFRLMGGLIGSIVVDTGSTLQIADEVMLTGSISGGGAVDVKKGRLFLNGVTAVASLLHTGGLAINAQTSAFSATLANPSVIEGNVPLSPTNIDAAVGVAGFGGNAFIPGGGSIATFG